MGQTALVKRDERNGQRLSVALDGLERFELSAAFWWYDAERERWSFVLASGLFRREGPRVAYEFVEKQIGLLESSRSRGSFLKLGQVQIVADDDARVVAMAQAVSVENSGVRVSGSTLNLSLIHI